MIIMTHYKDPYGPLSVMECQKGFERCSSCVLSRSNFLLKKKHLSVWQVQIVFMWFLVLNPTWFPKIKQAFPSKMLKVNVEKYLER